MCGIAGFYLSKNDQSFDGDKILEAMASCMETRGPDHQAIVNFGHVGFAHRRLSIIDLVTGNQPIYNETKSIAIVFNGEIYNYKELRSELEKKGHIFSTNSDTEVLVHLYEENGVDFLKLINGIAAIAIFDIARNKLILARDRFGVKPLYYAHDSRGVFFASEVAALKKIPGIGEKPNWSALSFYFEQLYIHQPESAWDGIFRMEAGQYIEISDKGIKIDSYYVPRFKPNYELSRGDIEEGIIKHLRSSVQRQLVSDVPVGMFLSSGLDSLAVLAAAVDAGAKPHSFTLSFDEPLYDESPIAQQVAMALHVPWTRIVLHAEDFIPLLEERLSEVSEPFCAWVNVGKKLLAQSAHAHGIPVCLSGAGGDEFFCGYPTLNAAVVAEYLALLSLPIRKSLSYMTGYLPAGTGSLPNSFAIRSFFDALTEKTTVSRFFGFKRIFSPFEYARVFNDDGLNKFGLGAQYDRLRIENKSSGVLDKLQYLDIRNFLEGSILNWADHATMRRSIEEREPLLDNELTEFALSIPTKIRFNLFKLKPVLRLSLNNWLAEKIPQNLLSGYKKKGFGLPLNDWLNKEPLKSYLSARLAPSKLKRLEIFNPSIGENILKEQWSGKANHFRKIQVLIGLVNHLEQI